MNSIATVIEHRQQPVLSPRLQRAVRLLQLSSLDFAQEVYDALGNNPFLESDEADNDSTGEEALSTGNAEMPFAGAPGAQSDEHVTDSGEHDGAQSANAEDERDSWLEGDLSGNRHNNESDTTIMEMRTIKESLSDHLLKQIHILPLSPRDQALAEVIVGSLDDDGYLRFTLDELTTVADLAPSVSDDELHLALTRVQSLEPAGIGARSVQECLLLQLPAIDCIRYREIARGVISEHMAALAARDLSGLARALGCTPLEMQLAVDAIRRLDPRPGWRFGSLHAPYVTPDVIVKKIRGNWTASLNSAIIPRVRLNNVYAEMFRRERCAHHTELAAHLQEARWTVSNIEQRFATILSVAQAIISHQHLFLDYGALAMKPLGLSQIADELGLHESTVSRVTNNKYMATPLGVFEFKYFFSRAMTTVSGRECSATAIRGLIKDMITDERSKTPLSDAEIARRLAHQGLVVARRTVTKYRQLMHIEPFNRRRENGQTKTGDPPASGQRQPGKC